MYGQNEKSERYPISILTALNLSEKSLTSNDKFLLSNKPMNIILYLLLKIVPQNYEKVYIYQLFISTNYIQIKKFNI